MIKTTHPIHYGGASKADTGKSNSGNDPCNPNCGSGFGGGFCTFYNNLMCSFTGTAKGIADTAQSGDKIAKMLPMAFILIILGLAVGFSKGHAIRIGG